MDQIIKVAHGLTKQTSGRVPDHTTWWPYVGVNRVEPFSDVVDVSEQP